MPKVPILMPQLGDSIAEATVLRLLAAYYHWSLPKSDYHDEPQTTTAAQTNQDSEIPQ